MVRIKNRVLGDPVGKIGNLVYRTINGKTFASIRPDKYNASQSKAAKSNRGRFAVAVQFAKYVNSIPELSKIWKQARVKGATSFNKIVKHNIGLIDNGSLTTRNIITPAVNTKNGLLDIKAVSFDQGSINITASFADKKNQPYADSPSTLYAVAVFQSPKSKNNDAITITHLSEDAAPLLNGEVLNIEMALSVDQKRLAKKYKVCIVYFTLIIDAQLYKNNMFTPSYSEIFNL